jgi:hypothetical protein
MVGGQFMIPIEPQFLAGIEVVQHNGVFGNGFNAAVGKKINGRIEYRAAKLGSKRIYIRAAAGKA